MCIVVENVRCQEAVKESAHVVSHLLRRIEPTVENADDRGKTSVSLRRSQVEKSRKDIERTSRNLDN